MWIQKLTSSLRLFHPHMRRLSRAWRCFSGVPGFPFSGLPRWGANFGSPCCKNSDLQIFSSFWQFEFGVFCFCFSSTGFNVFYFIGHRSLTCAWPIMMSQSVIRQWRHYLKIEALNRLGSPWVYINTPHSCENIWYYGSTVLDIQLFQITN